MGFGGYLKADTETNVTIGPVVAVANGYVPITNLDLSTADEAELIKHNATTTTNIAALTMAAIEDCDGYYALTLTAAVLDTEGRITVAINDDSLCLPVRVDFEVVNVNVYDSLFAAATTDYLQVDTLQVGGDAQSATDAKDFFDTGYNPSTHKVVGVVTTDACTTNTDMRGTDSAALASAWTSTRAGYVDKLNVTGTLANSDAAATYKADVSALALEATLTTIAGYLDTEIAAILADTGELQTDWVNGGRLDLLIDAIKAKSDLLTFEATTNFIKSVPQDFNDVSVADATTLTANSAGEIIRKMFWRDSGGNLAVTNATGATSLTKTNGTTEAGTCTVSYNAVSGKTTRTAMTWV